LVFKAFHPFSPTIEKTASFYAPYNSLIINNIGKFGWQAIVLATLSILGSLLASFLVFHLFFKKGGNE